MDKIRSFQCNRCSYSFIKQHASTVEKCPQCNYPTFDHAFENPFPYIHLSEKEMIRRLDPYARMKYEWYKYPKFHVYTVQRRKVVGDKTYMTDERNNRIGTLPGVIV